MPSNEGHIHFTYSRFTVPVNYADQDMEITAGRPEDPNGSLYIKAIGDVSTGLHIPTMGWQAVPGTSPALEARADAADPVGYLRLRIA